MTLDLDALTRKHERVHGAETDWCREDEQDWPCQTDALIARIRELEQQLTTAQAALDNPEITDEDLTNARREARIHGIHEATRADYARVFAIGHLRGYRAAANHCWVKHPDGDNQ